MPQRVKRASSCPLGQTDCPLLSQVAELQAECKHLLQLTNTDPLTGLYNLRYLLTILDQELERTRRTQLPTGLIMMDIDFFKKVNDSHGHIAGDRALQWVSGLLKENVRRIDTVCRYGGEEFAIILPGAHLHATAVLAERLRKLISGAPVDLGAISIPLTASFGVVVYQGDRDIAVRVFLDEADRMLLQAKAKGRNQVFGETEEARRSLAGVTSEERAALFTSRDAESRAKSAGRPRGT
jgi:two-component system cell cycle response regulator